jgi:hypothetical protein
MNTKLMTKSQERKREDKIRELEEAVKKLSYQV